MPSRPDGFWKIISSLLHAAHLILISVLDSLHTVSPAELARSTLCTLSSARSSVPPGWPAGKPSWLYCSLVALPKYLLIESDPGHGFPLLQSIHTVEASRWDLDWSLAVLLTSWLTLASHLCELRFPHLCNQDNNTPFQGSNEQINVKALCKL